jgi:RHS repeat-associated protein
MLTVPKEGTFSTSSASDASFPLAASHAYPQTRVRGSKPENLHCFSATVPVSVELRWGCEESSEKTAVGSGVSFKYDVFGRRIQKVFTQNSTTTTTNYVYNGDDTVEETDQNGNLLAKYARTLNIDEPLAESRSGTTSYYDQDGLGSVTSLTSAAGALANTYTFDSFGKTTNSTGSLTNPFRYTGRDFDTETNLSYYRTRYYDPNTGRFLSEDSIGFSAGTNFYVYVHNQAVNYVDPTGLDASCPWWVPAWLCRWWNKPSPPPAPKKPRPQVRPINICEAGEIALFWEAGPNPYYHGGAGEADWTDFQNKFIDKCLAAKTPGKYTHTECSSGAGTVGVWAYCMCCEGCDSKK